MWKDYSKGYIKNNRASVISIMAAALIATFFLSLLCSLAYNVWNYEENKADIPSVLVVFFTILLAAISFALVLIIRNSFELSMKERIHQLGILSSIGATPRQIRSCLLQEAVVLCTGPMVIGGILGAVACYGSMQAVNVFAADVPGRREAVFAYHPYVFVATFAASVCTVLLSVWLPAKKLSRLSPLQAIRNPGDLRLKKRKHSHILSLFFGIEGELAGNSLKARKKALRLCNLSLVLSFLSYSVMFCFITLSDISTRFTYFERYQDSWDIMLTMKGTEIGDFDRMENVRSIAGIRDALLYQKAEALTWIQEEQQSEKLTALGGLEAITGQSADETGLQIKASLLIMDDESFLQFCSDIGVAESLDGAIVLNRIWDSINSNFRQKEYIPFVEENAKSTLLYADNTDKTGNGVEVPILGYTQKTPVLREEYENAALVHFLPLSLWNQLSDQLAVVEEDSFLRILSEENPTLEELNVLEQSVLTQIGTGLECESENRIREMITNAKMLDGVKIIFGAFCALIAIIGIANMLFQTLGFLRQRKREFAQYMSVGLTPKQMKRIFVAEAFVIAGRPILITIPLTVALAQFMCAVSFLDAKVFWAEAPILPIVVFAACIVGSVAFAYYVGGKRLLRSDLTEVLRDDTL